MSSCQVSCIRKSTRKFFVLHLYFIFTLLKYSVASIIYIFVVAMFQVVDGDTSADKKTTESVQKAGSQSIERCIQDLEHYTYCEDKTCSSRGCMKMKKVLHHAKGCKRKNNNDCSICKQLITLCWYHAKSCTIAQCQVPYCCHIRNRLEQQQLQPRLY